MKVKNILVFALAVGISLFGAAYRWGDSAHSIGLIKADGGEALHPSFLEGGKDHYMLISTATVIPPYRGDVRVVLEGKPEMDYRLYFSEPFVDLGIKRLPKFRHDVLYGLQPRDRLAMWVEMMPPQLDPVCGMPGNEESPHYTYERKDYVFCSEACRDAFISNPEKYRDRDGIKGKYTLAMYDVKTGNPVLTVPIIFKGKGETADEGGHHH